MHMNISKMNMSCSNKAIKYLMFTFNFMFVITGIILIGVGAKVKSNYSTYDKVLDSKYFSLPNLLIATGVIIFLISFLGCYGAMKENWVMLMGFAVLLTIIFIFEFSAGIAGYVLRDKTSDYLSTELRRSMDSYNKEITIAIMWDLIQEEFECCGVTNLTDWGEPFGPGNYSLPISCCPRKDGVIGVFYCNANPMDGLTTNADLSKVTSSPSGSNRRKRDANPDGTVNTDPTPSSSMSSTDATKPSTTASTITSPAKTEQTTENKYPPTSTVPYSRGCGAAFGAWVESHAVDIGGLGFALAVIQLVGIGFAFHLARQVKNGYYST